MIPSASASSQCGFRSSPRQRFAPGADDVIGLLPADRHVRVGRVRDAQHRVVELSLDRGELRVGGGQAFGDRGRGSLELGDLGAARIRSAAHRLADALARIVALRLERRRPRPGARRRRSSSSRARSTSGRPRPCRRSRSRSRSASSRSRCSPTLTRRPSWQRRRAGGRGRSRGRARPAASRHAGPELRPRKAR